MSKIGFAFCAIYAALVTACLAFAFSSDGDFKGQFVLMQLPIAIQASVVDILGFGTLLAGMSWVSAYLILGLPTFALLYFCGWLLDRLRSRL